MCKAEVVDRNADAVFSQFAYGVIQCIRIATSVLFRQLEDQS